MSFGQHQLSVFDNNEFIMTSQTFQNHPNYVGANGSNNYDLCLINVTEENMKIIRFFY